MEHLATMKGIAIKLAAHLSGIPCDFELIFFSSLEVLEMNGASAYAETLRAEYLAEKSRKKKEEAAVAVSQN